MKWRKSNHARGETTLLWVHPQSTFGITGIPLPPFDVDTAVTLVTRAARQAMTMKQDEANEPECSHV